MVDRRAFVSKVGRLAVISGLQGAFGLTLAGCKAGAKNLPPREVQVPDQLGVELLHLVDGHFQWYAAQSDPVLLFQSLLEREVVSESGEFRPDRVAALAPSDSLQEYEGFYYTETELQVYGLAYALSIA